MKDLLVLLAHLLTTITKLLGPGGARAIVADSLLMKQQLLIINRSRRRAPNLSVLDRFLLGFWSLFLNSPYTGAAITDVQHLLGHASVKTTERAYAAFVKNERFKQTIDLLDTPSVPVLKAVE